MDKTRKMPSLLWLVSQQEEVVIPVHPVGDGPGRAFPAEVGSTEGKTAQWVLKFWRRFSHYSFQKPQKTFFQGTKSQVKLVSDSSLTPPQLSLSGFCLQSDSSSSPPRGTSERRELFQPTLQRKEAVQQC